MPAPQGLRRHDHERRLPRVGQTGEQHQPHPIPPSGLTQILLHARRAPQSSNIGMGYQRWYLDHMYAIAPGAAFVGQWLQSFREFPPRQKPGSFNLQRIMEELTAGSKQ